MPEKTKNKQNHKTKPNKTKTIQKEVESREITQKVCTFLSTKSAQNLA